MNKQRGTPVTQKHPDVPEVHGCTLLTGVVIRPRLIQPCSFAQPGTSMEVEEQTSSEALKTGPGTAGLGRTTMRSITQG